MSPRSIAWAGVVALVASCAPAGQGSSVESTRLVAGKSGGVSFVLLNGAFHHGTDPIVDIGRTTHDRTSLALRDPLTTVTLENEDLADAAGTLVEGSVVYREVHPGEDAVIAPRTHGFEELRVVHSARSRFVERVRLGFDHAMLSLRVRDGRAELVDRKGRVALGTDPAWCAGADGTRRDVTVQADGDIVTFRATLEGLVPPIVVDPVWTTVASMPTARRSVGTLRLADGRVMVAGGFNETVANLDTVELYDPSKNTWEAADPMPGLGIPSLIQLPSGRVVLTGIPTGGPQQFDPVTKKWSAMAGAPALGGYTARTVWSKKVSKMVLLEWQQVALFDDAASTWATGASNPKPRNAYAVGALDDGRVLVAGGADNRGKVYTTSQIYDPLADSWTSVGDLGKPRSYGELFALSSSRMLYISETGGPSGGLEATVEVFDMATSMWTAGPSAVFAEAGGVVPLGSDRFLVAADSRAGVFDGKALRWAPISQPTPIRTNYDLVSVGGGKALALGGWIGSTATNAVSLLTTLANGAACTTSLAGECTSMYCVTTPSSSGMCCNSACSGPCQQCDSSGTCQGTTGAPPGSATACAPYATCSAGACSTSCTLDSDCTSTSYCLSNKCAPRKALGAGCGASKECLGGYCADGVCCNRACTGQCESCDLSGDGTCRAVSGSPRGGRTLCADDGKTCGTTCNGLDGTKCNYLAAGTVPCGVNACSGGVETHASTCNGAGACADVAKSCGNYRCGSVTCRTACGSKLDCADGFICSLGACIAAPGLGAACTESSACATENCVDGVCCAAASCGAGSTCAAKGKEGRCTKKNGIACAVADECSSGACVEGHCCESACAGQCESCAVPGQVGKCRPVVGTPRAGKDACKSDSEDKCSARLCDGKERASCAAFVGADVECRAALCKDGQATAGASCAGSGSCPAVTTTSCGAYGCDGEGKRCLLACAANTDCAAKYKCVAGTCRPSGDTCDDAGTSAVFSDGTKRACVPYRCQGGSCIGRCATTEDCAPGYNCDGATCVQAAPPGDDSSGGCSHSPRSTEPSAFSLLALCAAFLLVRRAPRLWKLLPLTLAACNVGGGGSPPSPTGKSRSAVYGWTLSGEMDWMHQGGGIFLLPTSGDVLVTANGGDNERWSPLTAKWTSASTATPTLANIVEIAPGKLMTVGGSAGHELEAFLYEPTLDKYTALAAPPSGRGGGADAAWLGAPVSRYVITGSQLVAGFQTALHLYDPSTNTWTVGATPLSSRQAVALVTLSGGKLLRIGGYPYPTGAPLSTVEMYDGATNTWSNRAPMSAGRAGAAAVVLSTGKVVVAGGGLGAALYDPATNTWTTPGTSMTEPYLAGALLPGDRVLFAGGHESNKTGVWNPTTNALVAASAMLYQRSFPLAIALGGGKALVTGGRTAVDGFNFTTEIFQQQANGATCGVAGDCQSFFCVDGVCCDKACTGSCEACNLTGTTGTCIGVSGAPRSGHPSCAPYNNCVSGACDAACTSDSECSDDAWCNGSICVTKKTNGATCAAAKECVSGACADTVCCDVPCVGQCEACNVPGFAGTCKAVSGAPRGTRAACSGDGSSCAATCNGTDRKGCVFPSAATACGTDACTGGIETHRRTCDGIGHCGDVPKTCGAFACSGSACRTTCAANTDCAAGFVCSGTACLPAPGLGQACSATTPCSGSLFCTDGVCCGVASCGEGKSCALAAHKGECSVVNGTTCTSDGQCGSGACVDGVCCESSCDGQCQACDVAGSLGKCVSVKGEPHGKRIGCTKSKEHPCESTSCDGSDGSSCVALAGPETSCRAAKCADGASTSAGTCDGKGACGAATTTTCSPFACGSDGASCATTCTKADDCAPGFVCSSAACVKPFGRCSEDRGSLVDAEGKSTSCAPLVCKDGACLDRCTTTDDCVRGTACAEGQCVPPTVVFDTSGEDGGCGYGRRTGGRPGSLLVACTLLALWRKRRRAIA